MAVDAVLVVVDDRGGALGVGDARHGGGQVQRVGGGERPRVAAARPAGQAGVAAAQQHEPGHARAARRPAPARRCAARGRSRRGAAARATRPAHPRWRRRAPCAPGVGEAAQRDAGEDRLVVGVGVQDEDGVAAQIGRVITG